MTKMAACSDLAREAGSEFSVRSSNQLAILSEVLVQYYYYTSKVLLVVLYYFNAISTSSTLILIL